jgi:hypothetical protein
MTNIWQMRAGAVQWLRYDRQCVIVAIERAFGGCNADVVGVSGKRHVTEIEIKRTMADFRANSKKHGMSQRQREPWMHANVRGESWWTVPHQFYFLVEPNMVEKAKAELPTGCGLLSPQVIGESYMKPLYPGVPKLVVRVVAPLDSRARKLSLKKTVQMAKNQSGTLFSLLVKIAKDSE